MCVWIQEKKKKKVAAQLISQQKVSSFWEDLFTKLAALISRVDLFVCLPRCHYSLLAAHAINRHFEQFSFHSKTVIVKISLSLFVSNKQVSTPETHRCFPSFFPASRHLFWFLRVWQNVFFVIHFFLDVFVQLHI